jgi:hypothetical protein
VASEVRRCVDNVQQIERPLADEVDGNSSTVNSMSLSIVLLTIAAVASVTSAASRHNSVIGYVAVRFEPEVLHVPVGSSITSEVHVTVHVTPAMTNRPFFDAPQRLRRSIDISVCSVDPEIADVTWSLPSSAVAGNRKPTASVAASCLDQRHHTLRPSDHVSVSMTSSKFALSVRGFRLGRTRVKFYVVRAQRRHLNSPNSASSPASKLGNETQPTVVTYIENMSVVNVASEKEMTATNSVDGLSLSSSKQSKLVGSQMSTLSLTESQANVDSTVLGWHNSTGSIHSLIDSKSPPSPSSGGMTTSIHGDDVGPTAIVSDMLPAVVANPVTTTASNATMTVGGAAAEEMHDELELWWVAHDYEVNVVNDVGQTTTTVLHCILLALTAVCLVGAGGHVEWTEVSSNVKRPSSLAISLFCRHALMPAVSLYFFCYDDGFMRNLSLGWGTNNNDDKR